ncbi:MAG: hypothetical protein HOD60_10480, partial [Candidatus Nitrosopelagicus sp.]|nr:hypothetical protein [Candidatus Nitrosopelagicus sp.]
MKSVLIIALVAVAMIGVMVPSVFAANTVTNQHFLQVAENPENYVGSTIKVSGQIENKQVFENGDFYIFTVGGVENNLRNQVGFNVNLSNVSFSNNDCLVVEGELQDVVELENRMGASWDVPFFWLDEYDVVDCLEALHPTIAKDDTPRTQQQGNAKVTISKTQISDSHTRIFYIIDNVSQNSELSFYSFSSALIQDKTQFESEYVFTEYDDVKSSIPYGTIEKGWVVYETVSPKSFELRFEIREDTGNWQTSETYDMTFNIDSIRTVSAPAPIPVTPAPIPVTPTSDSNSIPSNPSDIFKEGAEKSVNFLDSLGVSGDTLFADQIIIKPYTDLKKYVDDENNFSILYPSMLTTFEEYVGGHGVKGLVAFRDEVYNTDLVYLSVFGKIPNIVGSANEILDQLEFSLLSNWNAPNTTVTILEKYAQEFNGHKHHIITLMAVEDGESVPLIYRAATSWVIVGDDLWEINSFHHHTPIRIALGFGYLTTEFLTVSEVEDIATIIMRSSDDQNVNLMTSFQKINASDNMIQKSIGIASFVDATKDPQHYIDRYNNEPTYKEWFDENYSQYSSIYEAVGLE